MNLKKYLAKTLIAVLVTSMLAGSQFAFASEQVTKLEGEFAPGRVIVTFMEDYNTSESADNLSDQSTELKALGLDTYDVEAFEVLIKAKKPNSSDSSSIEQKKTKKTCLITLKDKSIEGVLDAVEKLKNQFNVVNAQPDYVMNLSSTSPNDHIFGMQHSMRKISAPQAWDKCTGSNEIVVGVVDSGIDYTHPDLINNIWINTKEIPGDNKDNDDNGR